MISHPCYIALFLFCSFLAVVNSEDDVKCLQGLKNSLKDPTGSLSNWDFTNSTAGFICSFAGATCWTNNVNSLISLQLTDFNLGGQISDALQFCSKLQTLGLSGNALSGPIPSHICEWTPFLVTLDLSRNQFTGSIPENISNCIFLNTLALDNNKLSGPIPYQISTLSHLKKFTASKNDLSGTVPSFPSGVQVDFSGNKGLCCGPFGKCGKLCTRNLVIIIVAGVLGAAASLLLGWAWRWYFT